MFDIAKLDTRAKSEAGADMVVRHPTTGRPVTNDAGVPVTIRFMGRNSEAYRAVQRDHQRANADRGARGIETTEVERRAEMARVLSAMTLGWTFTEIDGQPMPYTRENAERLWNDTRWPWLNEQGFVFVNQEGNFLALTAEG